MPDAVHGVENRAASTTEFYGFQGLLIYLFIYLKALLREDRKKAIALNLGEEAGDHTS